MKRKKMFAAIFLLSLFILSCATIHQVTTKVVPDTARVVRLYVPLCTWEASAARVRAILMKIDGVYDVESDASGQYARVTYDPEKTSVRAFIDALSKEQFFVRGDPVFLK